MNQWGIPKLLEEEVKSRDKTCVYCGVKFGVSKRSRNNHATWEHIVNDASIITRKNIARCCVSCNSSKGTKRLADWLESNYCKNKNINKRTIAAVARKALKNK